MFDNRSDMGNYLTQGRAEVEDEKEGGMLKGGKKRGKQRSAQHNKKEEERARIARLERTLQEQRPISPSRDQAPEGKAREHLWGKKRDFSGKAKRRPTSPTIVYI